MKLKEIMKLKGISQTELAKELNLSQQIVSDWCRGYRKPKIKNLRSLSEKLDISVDELVDILLSEERKEDEE